LVQMQSGFGISRVLSGADLPAVVLGFCLLHKSRTFGIKQDD